MVKSFVTFHLLFKASIDQTILLFVLLSRTWEKHHLIIVVANTQSTNSILAAPARYLYACKGPINLQQQVVQNHFFQRLNEILFFFPFYFLSSHACVFSPEKLGWYGSSGPFYKNEMDVFRRHERRKSLSTFSSLFSLAYRGTL